MLLSTSVSCAGTALLFNAHLTTAHLVLRNHAMHARYEVPTRSSHDTVSTATTPESVESSMYAAYRLEEDLSEVRQSLGRLEEDTSFPGISAIFSVIASFVSSIAVNANPASTTTMLPHITFPQNLTGTNMTGYAHPQMPIPIKTSDLEAPVEFTTGEPIFSAVSGIPEPITPGILSATRTPSSIPLQTVAPLFTSLWSTEFAANTPSNIPSVPFNSGSTDIAVSALSDTPLISINPGGPVQKITTIVVSYSQMTLSSSVTSQEARIATSANTELLETVLPVAPAPTFSIYNQTVDSWNYTSHGSNDTLSSVSDGTTVYTSTQHFTIMVTAHSSSVTASPSTLSDNPVSDVSVPTSALSVLEASARDTTITFSATSRTNIAVYLSNDTINATSLSTMCQDPSINIINLPLITTFDGPNAYPLMPSFPGCDGSNSDQETHAPGLRSCPALAASITACQSLGKKVLISVSNSTFNADGSTTAPNSTFTSADTATSLATVLWNLFGAGTPSPAALRPFGSAATLTVDGFGVDDDLSMPYYDDFVQSLRSAFQADKKKTYYLSAAQPCTRPSTKVSDVLQELDFVYLRTQGDANAACAANWTQTVTEWNAGLLPVGGSGSFRAKNGAGAVSASASTSASASATSVVAENPDPESAHPTPVLFIGSTAWPVNGTTNEVEVSDSDDEFVQDVKALWSDGAGGLGAEMPNLGGVAFWAGDSGVGDGASGFLEEVKAGMEG